MKTRQKPAPVDPLLDVEAVSTALSVSLPTTYRLIESGELEAVRVSARGLRVSERALRDFIERRTIGK